MKEWALKYLSKLFLEQDLVSLGNQTQKSAKNQFGWGTILLIRGRIVERKKSHNPFQNVFRMVWYHQVTLPVVKKWKKQKSRTQADFWLIISQLSLGFKCFKKKKSRVLHLPWGSFSLFLLLKRSENVFRGQTLKRGAKKGKLQWNGFSASSSFLSSSTVFLMPCDEGMGSEISAKIIRRASSRQLGRSDAKKCQKSVWLWDLWSVYPGDGWEKKNLSILSKMSSRCFKMAYGPQQKGKRGRFKGKKKRKNCSNQDSRVVPHRSTGWSIPCLTSQIGRDAVLSRFCGRRWKPGIELRTYTPFCSEKTAKIQAFRQWARNSNLKCFFPESFSNWHRKSYKNRVS